MKPTSLFHLLSALMVIIALSIASPGLTSAENGKVRVWVQFAPGSKANVENSLSGANGEFHYIFDELNAFVVSVPETALSGLMHNPNVLLVEEDAKRYPTGQEVPFGIDLVQAREVWDADRNGVVDAGAPTGAGRKVCVIDSGVDTGHEDLQGVNFNGGYPNNWNTDTCGHGTHVVGTIAAMNNNVGVVGVTPGTLDLYIVKVFGDSCGWTYSSTLADAANRCSAARANVISMSLSGGYSSFEESTFNNLYTQGILSVAAAGNDGDTSTGYPAGYASVVSVAAIDQNKVVAGFSQKNPDVEVAAPGVGVLSTVPFVAKYWDASGYKYLSGTSMATPHVSAAAALIWSANPLWSNTQIREALNSTALDLGTVGRDTSYGYGLIQAKAALDYLRGGTMPPPEELAFTVTVATDKTNYTNRQTVYITTTVKYQGGAAVANAAVNVVITPPKGGNLTKTCTTGTAGTCRASWKIDTRKYGLGTYTVNSTATKAGYTAETATTSFEIP